MPGVPRGKRHDYVRNGTTNLYAALDVASGQVIAEMTPRHRAEEFRRFLNLIDASVPADLDVHVVLDNSSTHKTPVDPALARPPSAVHAPLHADLQLLAEPRRALVRRADDEVDQARHATAPSATSSPRSAPGSPTGTTTPSRSSGTRAPTRSSTASPPTASGSTTQVTRPTSVGIRPASRRPRRDHAARARDDALAIRHQQDRRARISPRRRRSSGRVERRTPHLPR